METNKRIQFDVEEKALARLDRLKNLTEATSYAEVIRSALRLYEAIIDDGGHNARLVIQKPDGTTAIVRVFT